MAARVMPLPAVAGPAAALPGSMVPRNGAAAFLRRHGWGAARIAPLAGDASFRRYFRLNDRGRRAVLMDAPPRHENVRPFLAVQDWLVGEGLSAPRLIAADAERGFLLIEDFGDGLMAPLLARAPHREEELYDLAVGLLAELGRLPPPAFLKPYDRAELVRELGLFVEWYAPAAGIALDGAALVAAFDECWGPVLDESARAPVVTLRDVHAENLMALDDREGLARLGLLDFQDALAGHRAYDLVSLLQDARRDVSPRLERVMLDRYCTAAGIADRAAFRAAYEILGAQRNLKILGIFVRLRDRDGRAGYVERLPRVWTCLERNLEHPALAPVRALFDAHVPAGLRAPWCR